MSKFKDYNKKNYYPENKNVSNESKIELDNIQKNSQGENYPEESVNEGSVRMQKKRWYKALSVLAVIVVFVTTYALIMPAITKEGETFCGYEEHKEHTDECYIEEKILTCKLSDAVHTHTDSCYKINTILTCNIEETEGHSHNDSCYTDNTYLICELEETEGHAHTDECYEAVETLVCTSEDPEHVHDDSCYVTENYLICGLDEAAAHTHGDSCFQTDHVLTCGLEEVAAHHHDANCYVTEKELTCAIKEGPQHVHTDECYYINREMVCQLPVHEHTLECYSDPSADLEDASVWERAFDYLKLTGDWGRDVATIAATQKGYRESKRNYKVQDDGYTINGYTRYGEWYGTGYEYEEWDTMFASFCVYYAGVPSEYMPTWADRNEWVRWLLKYDLLQSPANFIPKPGDMVFFDNDRDNIIDHMGIVSEVDTEERVADGADADSEKIVSLKSFYAMEGDKDNEVKKVLYYEGDTSIKGYAVIPENPEMAALRLAESQEEETAETAEETEEIETTAEEEIEITDVAEEKEETEATEAAEETEITEEETEAAEVTEEGTTGETETTEAAEEETTCETETTEEAIGETETTVVAEGTEAADGLTEQTIESEPASDGAVAVVSGNLPADAVITIEAVELSQDDLVMYFGAEKAAAMTSFVAYDIKILSGGEEWQPDETVNVTVRQPEIEVVEDEALAVAHVDSITNEATDIPSTIDEAGEIIFDTDGFSLYIFYTFTVDFHYLDTTFSIAGCTSILLSELFNELGIENDAAAVTSVSFTDNELITIEPVYAEDGVTIVDWKLVSLKAFSTEETLTIVFNDDTGLVLGVTDASVTPSARLESVTWNNTDNKIVLRIAGEAVKNNSIVIRYLNSNNASPQNHSTFTPNSTGNYSIQVNIPNADNKPAGTTSISNCYKWQVYYNGRSVLWEMTTYDLFDSITGIPAESLAKYEHTTFSDWLTNDYMDPDVYEWENDVAVAPTTIGQLITAFDHFYNGTGRIPRILKDEDIVYKNSKPATPQYHEDSVSDVTISKKIDYLGNNEGVTGMDDIYRLHLSLEAEEQPINLMLVLDQSSSMNEGLDGSINPAAGTSRQAYLIKFLNGVMDDHSDGFIYKFINSNEANHLSILTFGSDSNASKNIYTWNSRAAYVDLPDPLPDNVATNYIAALDVAKDLWLSSDVPTGDDVKNIMVFLGDGEPTIAYKDGRLHHSFAVPENVIGNGRSGDSFNIGLPIYLYMGVAAGDARTGATSKSAREAAYISPVTEAQQSNLIYDLDNNSYYSSRYTASLQGLGTYPLIADIMTMEAEIPGLEEFPMGNFSDTTAFLSCADNFKSFGDKQIAMIFGGTYNGVAYDSILTYIEFYDMYYLTESAFNEFVTYCPNVTTYSIGYSSSVTEGAAGSRDPAEVLMHFAAPGHYFPCADEAKLKEALDDILYLQDVSIQDALSEYSTLASDPQLEITMQHGDDEYTLYGLNETTGNYELTTDGANYLEIPDGASILDADGNLNVQFKAGQKFGKDFRCEVAFNIKPTDAAWAAKNKSGYNAEGDLNTDYDTAQPTSSELPGFYSNDNDSAKAEWTRGGEHELPFQKPVIQIIEKPPIDPQAPPQNPNYPEDREYDPTVTISKQIDYLYDNADYTGDDGVYRLYLDFSVEEEPIDLMLVIDQSASMDFDMAGYDSENINYDGHSRQEYVTNFLNGLEDDHSDGFIHNFINAVPGNDLAIVTFSSDSSKGTRYVRQWGSTADYINLGEPYGATNYMAALNTADDVWNDKSESTHRKLMIFISDGVPTIAYADGLMHHGQPEGIEIVGNGNSYSVTNTDWTLIHNISELVYNALDPNDVSPEHIKDYLTKSDIRDDSGNKIPGQKDKFFNTYSDEPLFPRVSSFSSMKLLIPGMSSWLDGTITDKAALIDFYDDFNDLMILEILNPEEFSSQAAVWLNTHVIQRGDYYDLFWLSENAFADPENGFLAKHPDVITYTIGYSDELNGTYAGSKRETAEVLKYYAGSTDRFFLASTSEKLAQYINIISGVSDIVITDPLSAHIDLCEAPNLEITMTQGSGESEVITPLYGLDEETGEYGFTEEGETYLDQTQTGFDSEGTLNIVFKPEFTARGIFSCEASFNVKVSEEAYQSYESNGNKYGEMIEGVLTETSGDEDTDHDSVHPTSSEMPGFYSNDGATASWIHGRSYDRLYPKPVVQLVQQGIGINLIKKDAATENPVSGARFKLYGSHEEEGVLVKDTTPLSGYENLKSGPDGIFSPENMELSSGTYFLEETAAAKGYVLPEEGSGIKIVIDETSETAPVTAVQMPDNTSLTVTCENDVYTITVTNVKKNPKEPVQPDPIDQPANDPGVTLKKQIDYLGDNEGMTGKDDQYRLFLTLTAQEHPIDLILVIDQSYSMNWKIDRANEIDYSATGPVRQDVLNQFLNGNTLSDGTHDGFIHQFLNSNDDNDLAIITFSNDCSDASQRYARAWGTSKNTDSVGLDTPSGSTNYMAALDFANNVWAGKPAVEGRKRIMIFLGDGAPTLAYQDGKMHSTFLYPMTGDGGQGSEITLVEYFGWYLENALLDIEEESGATYRREHIYRYLTKDDYDNIYEGGSFSTLDNGFPAYPVTIMMENLEIEKIPGMSEYPYGEFTDNDTFTEFATDYIDNWTDEERAAWLFGGTIDGETVPAHLTSYGDYYDIYWLSEMAFKEFHELNENVMTYTIGFSSSVAGETTEGERDKAEVLKYMSGANRYYPATSAVELADAINDITALSNVKMSDTLTAYVDVSETPGLEIKMITGTGDDAEETILYQNGAFTEAGTTYLDTAATSLEAGKLNVVFKPEYKFYDAFECVASFDVKVTEEAYDEWISNGQHYYENTDGTEGNGTPVEITGDANTDADAAGSITSSLQPGFYSNVHTGDDRAMATWTRGGNGQGDFPKPVVQVPEAIDILLKKVGADDESMMLEGAEFDLYKDCESTATGAAAIPGADGKYGIKLNASSIVSQKGTFTSIDGLYFEHYYLVETKAPTGYILPATPVEFDVQMSGTIEIDSASADRASANLTSEGAILLTIKNEGGVELPHTGGSGILLYTIFGICLMLGAAILMILRIRHLKADKN